ncbi:hypothetical protein GEMRC1_011349 [Eukaryota sp. GEM-RC1]
MSLIDEASAIAAMYPYIITFEEDQRSLTLDTEYLYAVIYFSTKFDRISSNMIRPKGDFRSPNIDIFLPLLEMVKSFLEYTPMSDTQFSRVLLRFHHIKSSAKKASIKQWAEEGGINGGFLHFKTFYYIVAGRNQK